jgi:hypothetical protein
LDPLAAFLRPCLVVEKLRAGIIDLGQGSMLCRLPDLVRHPLTVIAVLGLGLGSLHKRDAGSAVRNAVAVENSQVHEIIAEDMGDDRGERLSAVDVRKEPVTGGNA